MCVVRLERLVLVCGVLIGAGKFAIVISACMPWECIGFRFSDGEQSFKQIKVLTVLLLIDECVYGIVRAS